MPTNNCHRPLRGWRRSWLWAYGYESRRFLSSADELDGVSSPLAILQVSITAFTKFVCKHSDHCTVLEKRTPKQITQLALKLDSSLRQL